MTILEEDKIDIVASRPDSRVVKLVIADHLTWDDFDLHSQLLQNKINTYLDFVESGQMMRLEKPPIPPDPEVQIVLVLQYEPDEKAKEFLGRVGQFLGRVGIGFELELRHAN